MKKSILLPFCLLVLMTSIGSSAQVGIGTTTPRGALEINSSTNGFVAPQVALTSVTVSAPVVNPQTSGAPLAGTFVYNTATDGTSPNNVTPGYYFWNGSVWIKFAAGNTAVDVEDDLRVTLDKPGTTSAAFLSLPGTGLSNLQIWYFEDTKLDGMVFTLQLPHNWKNGTTIYPHIHWIPRTDDATASKVQWKLDYTWANLSTGTFTADANSPISGISTGPFTQNKHLLTDIGSIDGTGKTYSSVLICRLYRDAQSGNANDTYANSAGGLSMDFHISIKNPFVEYPE